MQMYGLSAPQTTPTQMFGSPQPLYASAPAGMQQQQQQHPHQQARPPPAYPPFRAPTNAPMMNGAMTSTSTAAQPGMPPSTLSLDYFMLLQTLGTGTFGQVRLCQQKATGKYFCLKILSKEKIVRLKQTEHVKSEKSVLAQISHPFIVKLYATFQDQANLYFLLEYISGGELFSCIRRNGRLSNSTGRFYAAEIVLAIRYLHSLHIAHRDLKPENLLLDSDGHIKLSDFGFAKVITDKTWTMCGTPEYIAPEVILSKGHDKAVDWWSLGVLIYEMLSGKPPFHGEHTFEIFEKILSAKVDMPAYFHPEAKDLIEKLLVVDVAKRLGGTRGGGADEVMAHPWFAGIDWEALHKRQLRAPINPGITGEGDSHNFPRYSDQTVEHKEFKENELFKDF
jgi:protein kinase X